MSTITFEQLALQIEHVSDALTAIVSDAINQGVTTRAWLTGYYIVEYEQQGEDRAQYGEQLLPKLSKRLQGKSFGLTNLKAYRKVYLTYTQLYEPVASYLRNLMEQKSQTPGFLLPENITTRAIGQTSDLLPMTTSDEFSDFQLSAGQLFTHLSFSHLVELSYIEDPLQRIFYEHQSVQGTWSVRELKRQIDTNYYLRSGWSKDPLMLQRLTTQQEGIDEQLFISKYLLQLPEKDKMKQFIKNGMK